MEVVVMMLNENRVLQALDLSYNAIDAFCLKKLAFAVRQSPNLKHLALNHCDIVAKKSNLEQKRILQEKQRKRLAEKKNKKGATYLKRQINQIS